MLCSLSSSLAFAQESDAEEEAPTEDASSTTSGEGQDSGGLGSLRRSNRMEFDARLVRGETAGSGAVFLFQRAPRALPSMVPLRKSYLHRSVDQVLTPEWQKSKRKSVTTASSQDILTSDVVNTTTGNQEVSSSAAQGEEGANASPAKSEPAAGKGSTRRTKKKKSRKK